MFTTEPLATGPLVLSIQSHMVHGRSGNRSAIFPLELNGINVDPLNTVQYSTHTAYPFKKGPVLSLDEFQELIEGLKLNKIFKCYTHLLTGYVSNPDLISEIVKVRKEMNSVHYLCDPVLGDNGKFYVPENCFEPIKTLLVPCADTITPNFYEAMWLTDLQINNQKDCLKAVNALHEMGPKNVIISSTEWSRRFIVFSWEKGKKQFAIETPSIGRHFEGPGDVFASLLLANLINYPGEYEKIAVRTVNAVYEALLKTSELKEIELALPQAAREMLDPQERFHVISCDEFLNTQIDFK